MRLPQTLIFGALLGWACQPTEKAPAADPTLTGNRVEVWQLP